MPGGRELDETVRVAQLLEEHGVAFVDISAGIFEAPGTVMDPMYYPQGWNTYTAEEVKQHVKIPVITSHTLRDPDYCERILAEGKADLVGLSRQMIADPYWANKAFDRQPQEIRKCISCLVGCWQESLMIKRHMRCAINPAVGDERFIHLPPAGQACRVAVVGGGPGGMEAARIATLRGHQVTIFEKTGELGGAILCCCTVPGKHKMRWYADWLPLPDAEAGRRGASAGQRSASSNSMRFDAVILATGGRVRAARRARHRSAAGHAPLKTCCAATWSGASSTSSRQAAAGRVRPDRAHLGRPFRRRRRGRKAGRRRAQGHVVTENAEFAAWMEPCHRDVMIKRFAGGNGEGLKGRTFAHPVTVIPSTTVLEIVQDGQVTLMDSVFRKTTLSVTDVVLANVVPVNDLAQQLLDAGKPVTVIGDAKAVRNLRAAVTEGANAGLTLDEGLQMNANQTIISKLPTEVVH